MSVGFLIDFYNNTGTPATLTAKVQNINDWESGTENNPAVDIKGYHVPANALTSDIHLERHNRRATAPFTVTADIGGNRLVFQLDGCDATDVHDRASIPVSVGGDHYTVLQVITKAGEVDNGNATWNKMSVFITPRIDTKRWMAQFPLRTLMSLNVPGTHDTGTYGGNAEMGTRCQTMDIKKQLESGIRFLDLRLVLDKNGERPDDLGVFHGDYFQNVWLKKDIIPAVNTFLAQNPSECVVFCVNRESGLSGPKGDPIDGVLHDILVKNLPPNTLFDHNTAQILTTTLDALKGCVVLLRQDNPQTFGLDVSNWPDGQPYSSTPFAGGKGAIVMQNQYEQSMGSGGVKNKWDAVKAHLARAAHVPTDPKQWFLNWTNASHTPPTLPWYPWGFAYDGMSGVNFLLAQHLVLNTKPGACRFGTVVMDFPEEPPNNTLIKLLLAWNAHTPVPATTAWADVLGPVQGARASLSPTRSPLIVSWTPPSVPASGVFYEIAVTRVRDVLGRPGPAASGTTATVPPTPADPSPSTTRISFAGWLGYYAVKIRARTVQATGPWTDAGTVFIGDPNA